MFHLLGFLSNASGKLKRVFGSTWFLRPYLFTGWLSSLLRAQFLIMKSIYLNYILLLHRKISPIFFQITKAYILVEDILKDASQLLLSCIKKRRRRRRRRTKSEHTPSRNHVIKTCVSTIWLLSKTTFKSPCCRKNTGQHGFKKVRGEVCARRFSDQSQTWHHFGLRSVKPN